MERSNAEKTYNILDTLNAALVHGEHSSTIRDGSWTRFNTLMDELASAYNDEVFKDYKVEVHIFAGGQNGKQGVMADEFKRKVYSATLYLHTQYLSDFTSPPLAAGDIRTASSSAGHTFIQAQNAEQRTEVNVELQLTLVQMTEALTRAEAAYPDENSKENKFIKKVKSLMPVAKSTIGIITALLQAAHEFGLTPDDILKILRP